MGNKEPNKTQKGSFSREYTELYDIFYSDKNYNEEVDFLIKVFKKYDVLPGQKLLDIGCGTGNHSIKMAKRGYNVTGIDPSESMLEIARRKSLEESVKIELKKEGLPELNLAKKYDGVECMFNVIDYVLEDEKILKSFINIRECLNKKGIFVFDFRNAIPSLRCYNPKRVIHVKNGEKDIFRVSNSNVDPKTRIFHTKYECFVLKKDKLVDKFEDEHKVRSFYIEEMKDFISQAKLDLQEMFPFWKPGEEIREGDWNIVGVCKK